MKQASSTRKLFPLVIFAGLLLLANLHLFQGNPPTALMLRKELVAAGEWWRLITHPLVHVSWYHLILDGSVVALLWHELHFQSLFQKADALCSCAVASLGLALLFSPQINEVGYCGLSGIAHGLMFLLGLQWMKNARSLQPQSKRRKNQYLVGGLMAGIVAIKGILEVSTGSILFDQVHGEELGIPIVHAHLGGVIGGLFAFITLQLLPSRRHPKPGEYKEPHKLIAPRGTSADKSHPIRGGEKENGH